MQAFSPKTGRKPIDCQTYMIANAKWKYIHAPGFAPMLFDLENDPEEFIDLGRSQDHEEARAQMHYALADWALQYRQRETVTEERADHMIGLEDKLGVLIGYWDENDIAPPAQAPDYSALSKKD